MRVLIVNGATGPDPLLDDLSARLARDFETREASVEVEVLRSVPVAYCQGCFECWTHSPGLCKIDDRGRDLARAFITADAVLLVTPVRFGSYSWECKKMLDRTLGMLLPFFQRVDGEVHHQPRYRHPPAFGVLAVLDAPDADVERTVRTLALRNAINFAAPRVDVEVITRRDAPSRVFGACDALVAALEESGPDLRAHVEDVERQLPTFTTSGSLDAPTRAMLLVGSAKPRGNSTSESLGVALFERLALRGVSSLLRHVHRDAHDDVGVARLVAELRAVPLLVVATPLYIDALPALVTRLLEAIVADRRADPSPAPLTVMLLVNCGFPESRHTAVATAIGALFARSARAHWAGALQLGGGGVINGRPLTDVGHVAHTLAAALDASAEALAEGRPIPDEARAQFRQPLMSTGLYMAAGDAGWLWTAVHEGTLTKLWHRPATLLP